MALIIGITATAAMLAAGAGSWLLRIGRQWPLTRQLWVVVLAPVASVIAASLSVAPAMFISTHDLTVTLWIAAVAGVVSVIPATLLGRSIMRTTQELLDSARLIGSGTTTAPRRHRSVELTDLATELANSSRRLAEARRELEQMDASRRDLVAWVSHDLRSPLASARAMAEALEDGLVDEPTRYYRGIRTQIDRLSKLVDDLFELTKISSGRIRLERSTMSVYDLVSDQIADFAPLAAERRVRIEATGDLGAMIEVDPHHMSRALGNLLSNAVQYSPPGSQVEVTVEARAQGVDIAVSDTGGGIRDEDLPRVFDAGWRGDESRAGDRSSGAGLGLAIVRGIAHLHDGEVQVRNIPGGSRFTLHLRRADETAPSSAALRAGPAR